MRISSVSKGSAIQLPKSNVSSGSNREQSIQRRIQSLERQLGAFASTASEELSQSEISKKEEIRQEMVELQQELQEIRAAEQDTNTVVQKEVNGRMRMQVKEDGLGDYIDEYA